MPLRSMTGYSQVKGQVNASLAFALGLKSVNHRFLDLHFRLPSDADALEMKLRRLLKDKLARGHVELSLNLARSSGDGFSLNKQIVGGYVQAFRDAASEFGLASEPDLNAALRVPGAVEAASAGSNGELEGAVLAQAEVALESLSRMRDEEGGGIDRELRERMQHIAQAGKDVEQLRHSVLPI